MLRDILDRLRFFASLIGVQGYDGKPTGVVLAWQIAFAGGGGHANPRPHRPAPLRCDGPG